MSKYLSVACLQYASKIKEEKTLKEIIPLINKAVNKGNKLITLPECATSIQKNAVITKKVATTERNNISLQTLKEVAKTNAIYILIGSLPIKNRYKLSNRSFLIGPNGKILYRYDKIHLFDVVLPNGSIFRESQTYKQGSKAIIATLKEICDIKIGLTICYDLRFPYLYRDLASNGAQIITIPSAFSNFTGPLHWNILLRTRAIETGCFILAPAQTGVHECGRASFGHSLIVSPWGKVIADAGKKIGFISAKINLNEVENARQSIPSLNSTRLYSTNF